MAGKPAKAEREARNRRERLRFRLNEETKDLIEVVDLCG